MGTTPSLRTVVAMAGTCLALVALACGKARSTTVSAPTGTQIRITGASVDGASQVVVDFTVTQDDRALAGTALAGLQPNWTLAVLSVDPTTVGLAADPASPATSAFVRPPVPAWQSLLLTGSGTLERLPIDGPGTPDALVQSNVRQPGAESGGTVQDLGGGKFTYTFTSALPQGFERGQTLRVGVWLGGTSGTNGTTSTFDFVPSGGAPQVRELVLDANCNKCHGVVQAHGGFRTGVKLCVTCHTYQNADPNTVDPAAVGATPSTNPNPLDLGRLVHRIHRGRNLPTLYDRSGPTQPSGSRANVARPFFPGMNAPHAGQKYSVVGFQGRETVYGQVATRIDNGHATTAASGIGFPQDLRNCDACHAGAAQAAARFTDISRRTCAGCHTDAWFGDPARIAADLVHYMHPGDTQPDDSACYGCHVPTSSVPEVDADITALHVPPEASPNWNGLSASIVSVQNMLPGQAPTVVFTLGDRDGTISPLGDPNAPPDSTSPVPRGVSYVAITMSGPTSPDYLTGNAPITEQVPSSLTADASGRFSYTFTATVPASATGSWAVAVEARRQKGTAAYDSGSDSYSWPFTGETIREFADNPVQYVDVRTGSAPGGAAIARRQVVSRENCNGCHMSLGAHGGTRHSTEYCVMCHAPDATDWSARPKDGGNNTDLGATVDGLEERSIHFDVLIHRIHTGARTGSAELDLARPFAVYGFGQSVHFFDDVRFPNKLATCTLCHVGSTYEIESVPGGAQSSLANEMPTIQHAGGATHGSSERMVPPIQAACLGCHDTGAAQLHAQENIIAGIERCADCHGMATSFLSVDVAHGLPRPAR